MAPARDLSNVVEIYDIRRGKDESSLREEILKGLTKPLGQKNLTTILCYDEPGLKIFEDITYLEEYYLTNAEIDVLHAYSCRLADRIEPGSIIVELGSG